MSGPAPDPHERSLHRQRLRERLAGDLAAGRTVALTDDEMADPELRAELPRLLDELERARGDRPTELQIPGYTVLGEIGSGGMSTVYLARHEQLDRHDALKILHGAGEPRARQRLLREARAMAALRHPHIVTIYDIVETPTVVAIAMEWVDGLSLAALLHALPELPTARDMTTLKAALGAGADADLQGNVTRTFVRLVHDTALAAHAAHRQSILHLDIKPSNVLVRRDGRAQLTDFGVARNLDLDHTQTQSFAGTPIYAAPEQLRRDHEAFSPATDVYALGMTLYELLARRQPLREQGLSELLRRVEAGRLPRLSTLAEVASDLENVVHKAIAVEPGNRYPTAAAFAADLDAFLDGRPVAAKRATTMQRLRRWMRAEPWQAALVAVLLVGLPVLIAIGGKLWSEMPRITAAERREDRERAADVAQIAFQSFLIREEASARNIARLRDALATVPDDQIVIACLLMVLGQDHKGDALRELDDAPLEMRESAGGRALRERLESGQPFFRREIARQLARSADLFDLKLVVLDRVLRFRDARIEEDLEMIATAVEKLRVGYRTGNPLAHGLKAWIAAQLGDRGELEIADFALQQNWPDNEAACLWRVIANTGPDRERARAIARDFLATHPGNYVVTMRLATLLMREKRTEAALSLLDGIARPGLPANHLLMRCSALHDLGRTTEARALFDTVEPTNDHSYAEWLKVLELFDVAAAKREYETRLGEPRPSATYFHQAMSFAVRHRDREFVVATGRRASEVHPGMAMFRWRLAPFLMNDHDWQGAGRLVDGLELPRAMADELGHIAVVGLAAIKDFEQLLRICDRWLPNNRDPEERWRATFFRALALSRLGQHQAALRGFDAHIEAAAAAAKRPYAGTGIERAWIMVAPDAPPEVDDLQEAVTIAASRAVTRSFGRKPKAWHALVLAEIAFRNGDPARAATLLKRAEELSAEFDLTAPADLRSRIAAAAARYGD